MPSIISNIIPKPIVDVLEANRRFVRHCVNPLPTCAKIVERIGLAALALIALKHIAMAYSAKAAIAAFFIGSATLSLPTGALLVGSALVIVGARRAAFAFATTFSLKPVLLGVALYLIGVQILKRYDTMSWPTTESVENRFIRFDNRQARRFNAYDRSRFRNILTDIVVKPVQYVIVKPIREIALLSTRAYAATGINGSRGIVDEILF